MSILKHASFQILSATVVDGAGQQANTYAFAKVGHKADFSHVDLKPGYLYVRSRAISSRTNDNYDSFPAEEIKKAYKTFIGRPTFVNHNNSNHRRARGVIVDAVLHEDVNPDGTPDIWVEAYHEIDAQTFPMLAKAVIAGEVARTSMGCDVEYSICSFCNNKAYTPNQYCAHIPRLKGKRIRRVTGSSSEDVLVSEICIGLNFFENSLLVEEPADPTAYVLGVDGIGVTASKVVVALEAEGESEGWQKGYEDGYYGRADEKLNLIKFIPLDQRDQYKAGYDAGHDEAVANHGTNFKRGSIDFSDDEMFPDPDIQKSAGISIYFTDSTPKDYGEALEKALDDYDEAGKRRGWAAGRDMQHAWKRYEDLYDEGKAKGWLDTTKKPPKPFYETFQPTSKLSYQYDLEDGMYDALNGYPERKDPSMIYREGWEDALKAHPELVDMPRPEVGEKWEPVAASRSFGGQRVSMKRLAIGEVVAPPKVDTLRQDACPLCGSDDFNGDECPICMYTKPPDQFMDPDLDIAGLNDLRQQNANPIQDDLMEAEGGDLACPECGAEFSGDDGLLDDAVSGVGLGLDEQGGTGSGITSQPDPRQDNPDNFNPSNHVPSSNLGEPPAAPTEPHPGPHIPETEKKDPPPAGESLPKPSSDDGVKKDDAKDDKPSGKPLDQANDLGPGPRKDDKDGAPSDPDDPAKGAEKPHKEGEPCPNCGKGKLEKKMTDEDKKNPFAKGSDDDDPTKDDDSGNPFAKKDGDDPDHDGDDDSKDSKDDPDKDKDDKDDKEDEHSAKDDKSKQGMKAISISPNEVKVAQSSLKVIAKQAADLKRANARIAQLEDQVAFIAKAAGLVPNTRTADVRNPAQPIPAPASEAPDFTTQEAMTPMSRVDVTQIGAAPGATDVRADTTDTVDSIGGIDADTPYRIDQTVTAPVAGTEGRRPLDEVRTVPEIQFGNPLKPDAAFPLQGDIATRPTLASSQERTFASLRLARLRKECGVVDPDEDDLVVAQVIANNSEIHDDQIAYEIETLSQVAARQGGRNPRQASRSTVPQMANTATRTMPSVTNQAPLQSTASVEMSDDDQFSWI